MAVPAKVVQVLQNRGARGIYKIRCKVIEGEEEGSTEVVFQLIHNDHIDYETPPIEVEVE